MRYGRRFPEELALLAGLLPQITVLVTIINGRHDRVVPIANAEFLDHRLPVSRLVIIDAGHFVWEEEPAEYASAVLDPIMGNQSRAKGASDDQGVPHAAGRPQRRGCVERGD
jgi:pimeloyl-ACP methyl ester carboxylesterase